MKPLIGLLTLLPAVLCFADVAVYNGMQVITTTSIEQTGTRTEKFVEVIDLASAQLVTIKLEAKAGKKSFFVAPPAVVVKTEVQTTHGNPKPSMVLAQAVTTTDSTTGVVTLTSFLQKGINGQVVIKGTEKTSLPRNLHGSASVVSTASSSATETTPAYTPAISPALVEVKAVLNLQEAASRASNDAGDTLAAAVQRVKASLLANGYVDGNASP